MSPPAEVSHLRLPETRRQRAVAKRDEPMRSRGEERKARQVITATAVRRTNRSAGDADDDARATLEAPLRKGVFDGTD
jgi:hypothetical protein